jgi:hypothetical protein
MAAARSIRNDATRKQARKSCQSEGYAASARHRRMDRACAFRPGHKVTIYEKSEHLGVFSSGGRSRRHGKDRKQRMTEKFEKRPITGLNAKSDIIR